MSNHMIFFFSECQHLALARRLLMSNFVFYADAAIVIDDKCILLNLTFWGPSFFSMRDNNFSHKFVLANIPHISQPS